MGSVGAIYYGSQYVNGVIPNTNQPYTTSSPIKDVLPVELEVAFVVVMLVGFGVLSYGVLVSKFNKPPDYYSA